jgi:hypothetical protein
VAVTLRRRLSMEGDMVAKKQDKVLTADDIMKFDDRPVIDVDVPEWGIVAKVREVDAYTLAKIAKSARDEHGERDWVDYSARVIIAGCVEPQFTLAHLPKLKEKSNRALIRLYNAITDGKKN